MLCLVIAYFTSNAVFLDVTFMPAAGLKRSRTCLLRCCDSMYCPICCEGPRILLYQQAAFSTCVLSPELDVCPLHKTKLSEMRCWQQDLLAYSLHDQLLQPWPARTVSSSALLHIIKGLHQLSKQIAEWWGNRKSALFALMRACGNSLSYPSKSGIT